MAKAVTDEAGDPNLDPTRGEAGERLGFLPGTLSEKMIRTYDCSMTLYDMTDPELIEADVPLGHRGGTAVHAEVEP